MQIIVGIETTTLTCVHSVCKSTISLRRVAGPMIINSFIHSFIKSITGSLICSFVHPLVNYLISLKTNYLKKKIPLAFEKYKKHKNLLTNLIRTSERLYYQDKFNSAMSDIKTTWHVLKNIVNTDYSTKPCVKEIKIKNQLINDQNIIAQKFNEYFVSIESNLAEKTDLVKGAPGDAVSYISGHYKNSIFLTNASPNEICSIVSCLKSACSSGYDEIPIPS